MDAEAKVDKLFLSRGCPDCAPVRAALKLSAAGDDSFKGADGQGIMVFGAQSDKAARVLLDKFGYDGKFTPLLVTHDGKTWDKPNDIIAHLRRNGMAVES
jgi:hypothetical protein